VQVEDVLYWWPFAALALLLVPAAIYDAGKGVIPKFLTYPALAVGLIGHTLAGGLTGGPAPMQLGLMGSILGFAMGFGPMLAVFLTGGIGGGDVKLMGAVGALTGWRFTLEALFLGLLVAVLMAVVILIRRRIAMQTLGRLARWFWIVLSMGKPGDPSTSQSPRLPFGVALSIGSALALAEVAWRGVQAGKLVGV
jgi:prepilin peptidase CpaA